MDDNEHITKVPRSAYDLFVKLYWKRKSEKTKCKNSVAAEATKSWIRLSEAEKLEFKNKFNECKALYVANQLKNLKPYLKKKKIINSNNIFSDNVENSKTIPDSNFSSDDVDGNISQIPVAENNSIGSINHNPTYDEILNDSKPIEDTQQVQNEMLTLEPTSSVLLPIEDTQQVQKEVILEPTPPVLLSAQELFNMIQKEDDKTWSDLLPAQRRRFQYAVLTIKKNYLKQYKLYLEHLSNIELIAHYKKVKNALIQE